MKTKILPFLLSFFILLFISFKKSIALDSIGIEKSLGGPIIKTEKDRDLIFGKTFTKWPLRENNLTKKETDIIIKNIQIIKKKRINDEREKLIKKYTEALDLRIAENERLIKSGKINEVNFILDLRHSNVKVAYPLPVNFLSSVNPKLVAFNNIKSPSRTNFYVLLTSEVPGSDYSSEQLLKWMDDLNEKEALEEINIESVLGLAIKNIDPTDQQVPHELDQALTQEIINRSKLGDNDKLGVLLHWRNYFIGEKQSTISRSIAFDSKISSTTINAVLSEIEAKDIRIELDKDKNKKFTIAECTVVLEKEIDNAIAVLKRDFSSIQAIYERETVDLLNNAIISNQSKLNNSSYNPLEVNVGLVNSTNSTFRHEGLNYVLDEINAFPNVKKRADLSRKLAYYEYNTKKQIYVVFKKIQSLTDKSKIDLSTFALNVWSASNLNKSDAILICIPYLIEAGNYSTFPEVVLGDNINQSLKETFETEIQNKPSIGYEEDLKGYSNIERAILLMYFKVPKPFIRYTYILNAYGENIRILSPPIIAEGLPRMRELILLYVSGYDLSTSQNVLSQYSHKLHEEYVDEYNQQQAVNVYYDSKNLQDAINKAMPSFTQALEEVDYIQLTLDAASLAGMFLPPYVGVVIGGVALIYSIQNDNYVSAGFATIEILSGIITKPMLVKFLKGLKWTDIAADAGKSIARFQVHFPNVHITPAVADGLNQLEVIDNLLINKELVGYINNCKNPANLLEGIGENSALLGDIFSSFNKSDQSAKEFIEVVGESVEGWKIVKTFPESIRQNTGNLEKLSKALKQDGYSTEYFEKLLKSKDDPQKFIDDFVNKIGDNGKFVDNVLENDYASYLARKAKEGKPPRDRADWKEASDYMKLNSPTARGNKFNRKAWDEEWYPFWEVYLDNGKYLDGYNPFTKEIVSRKATDLVDISESTFVKHLDEILEKYAPPRVIKSQKPGYENLFNQPLPLDGKLILEIPASNKTFYDLNKYIKIASDKGITLKFMSE